jgi:hypothetical protein
MLQRKVLLPKITAPKHKRILRLRFTEKGQEMVQLCHKAMDKLSEGFGKEEVLLFSSFTGKILAKSAL